MSLFKKKKNAVETISFTEAYAHICQLIRDFELDSFYKNEKNEKKADKTEEKWRKFFFPWDANKLPLITINFASYLNTLPPASVKFMFYGHEVRITSRGTCILDEASTGREFGTVFTGDNLGRKDFLDKLEQYRNYLARLRSYHTRIYEFSKDWLYGEKNYQNEVHLESIVDPKIASTPFFSA